MSGAETHVPTDHPVLTRYDRLPDGLLEVPAGDVWRQLPGPSLFHIPGRDSAPLFVSVLLHGNEDTGWRAVQQVLREHRRTLLPRALLLFVGNVAAAKACVRTLPDQHDYNRAWPGTPDPATPTARLMAEVVEIVRHERPFASIDIHNNTGHNPHYACVSSLAEKHLHLARLFGRTVVYFTKPLGVQSAALAPICPAATVECGRAGPVSGVSHAAEFIFAALALQHFPEHPVPAGDLDLMRTFAIIKVPPDASFCYDGSDCDFRFRDDLDRLNFSELEAGTCFGLLGGTGTRRLDVIAGAEAAGAGVAATAPYFDYSRGEIRLSQQAIPAMLTLDPRAVRLDSLGYLMHRIGRDGTLAD
jgi:Succinylglutamate desuccinylase / Aspartoacylase family